MIITHKMARILSNGKHRYRPAQTPGSQSGSGHGGCGCAAADQRWLGWWHCTGFGPPRRLVLIALSQTRGATSSSFFRGFQKSITQGARRLRTHGVRSVGTGTARVARVSVL